jgi:SAM-dependent methyltransferase
MPRNTHSAPLYIAHVVPGIEGIAEGEIAAKLAVHDPIEVLQRFDERTSLLLFGWAGTPRALLELGTVEDVFALAARADDIPASRAGLGAVRSLVAHERRFTVAADLAFAVRPRRGRTTFRVIARKAGDHAFRRVDLQRAVEWGVLDRLPAWRLVEDDAQIELWAHLVGSRLVVGIRLSDNTLRQRQYRQVSLPAALKPTVAHAMALISEPREDDVVLDPMCGSGTILIERARAGRYRLLLGGDADEAAVEATRENMGPRYKPVRVERWDARRLPIDDHSVSAIITNTPFGKQIGTPEENRTIYPQVLAEWVRVLREDGRMVLLSGDRALLRRTLERRPELRIEWQMQVLVRGYRATLAVATMGSTRVTSEERSHDVRRAGSSPRHRCGATG